MASNLKKAEKLDAPAIIDMGAEMIAHILACEAAEITAATLAEFSGPADWQSSSSPRKPRNGGNGGGSRGKAGSGKRAVIKHSLLDAALRGIEAKAIDHAGLATMHDSSVSSVRSILTDLLGTMRANRLVLIPEFRLFAGLGKTVDGWRADFEAMLYARPNISTVEMLAEMVACGHSGTAGTDKAMIGASIGASRESLAILRSYGCFAADLMRDAA